MRGTAELSPRTQTARQSVPLISRRERGADSNRRCGRPGRLRAIDRLPRDPAASAGQPGPEGIVNHEQGSYYQVYSRRVRNGSSTACSECSTTGTPTWATSSRGSRTSTRAASRGGDRSRSDHLPLRHTGSQYGTAFGIRVAPFTGGFTNPTILRSVIRFDCYSRGVPRPPRRWARSSTASSTGTRDVRTRSAIPVAFVDVQPR